MRYEDLTRDHLIRLLRERDSDLKHRDDNALRMMNQIRYLKAKVHVLRVALIRYMNEEEANG